jgi:hypothetical protein
MEKMDYILPWQNQLDSPGSSGELVVQGKIVPRGVQIPVWDEIYGPVMEELKSLGVEFKEQEPQKAGNFS